MVESEAIQGTVFTTGSAARPGIDSTASVMAHRYPWNLNLHITLRSFSKLLFDPPGPNTNRPQVFNLPYKGRLQIGRRMQSCPTTATTPRRDTGQADDAQCPRRRLRYTRLHHLRHRHQTGGR